MIKGNYGYIKAKKNNLIKWLVIDILVAVGLFVIGLFINGYSKANIFTIFAMLFTVPGAKIVVSMVVVAPFKSISKDSYEKIKAKVNNKKNVLYDLVLTSPEKVMYITSMCINKEEYIILPNDNKKLDVKHMENYIKKHMANYDFEKEIIVIKDEKEYVKRINRENFEEENLDRIIKTIMILQV